MCFLELQFRLDRTESKFGRDFEDFWSMFWDYKVLVGPVFLVFFKSKCSSERNLNNVSFPYDYFLELL